MVRQVDIWQLNYKRVKQNLATEPSSGISCTFEKVHTKPVLCPDGTIYQKQAFENVFRTQLEFAADFINLVFACMQEKASDFYSSGKWRFLCHLRFLCAAHNSFSHLPCQYLLGTCSVQSYSGIPKMNKIHPQAVCSLMEI